MLEPNCACTKLVVGPTRCTILPDSTRSSSVVTRSNGESRRETRYCKGERQSKKEAFVSFNEEKNFRQVWKVISG